MRKHLLLMCALVLGSLTSAFCAEKYTYTYTDEEGNLKRIYLELNTTTKEATVVSGEWEYTKKIIIPDAVEYPEGSGTMYKITTIGKGGDATQANCAFYYCYDLDEVVLGANVKTIKTNAFYRCGTESRPVKLNLDSDGLTTIEANAINQVVLRANYGDNTILLGKNITQFGPASATETSNWNPWGNLINITAFKVADGNTALSTDANGVLYNYDKTTLISFPKYRNITTFDIPSTVATVRSYAFYKMQKLKTVTGGNNVVRLGSVISGLTSLRMGPKLTTMSSSAFMYCNESFVPDIDPSNTTFKLIDKVLFKYEGNKVTLCWFLRGNKTENYVMPNFVTDIPSSAFYPNAYLKTIDFSEAELLEPSHIDANAFLGTVNSIEFTGAESFYHNVDGVWYNYDYTRLEIFGSDATVENFVMHDATTTLPRAAVKTNTTVKTIEFNKKLSSFDSQDFYKWENLEEYRVKEGNGKLWADADGVLYNNAKTKVVAYPRGNTRAYYKVVDGTTNVGTYAFYKNKYLMALDLGDDIKSVVESNCSNLAGMEKLKAIKVGTMVPPTVTTSTFTNSQLTGGKITLYVPKDSGAEDIYKNASIWNRFAIVHDVSKFEEEIRQINVDYDVQHHVQNAEDDDYTFIETNTLTGKLFGETTATAKNTGDYVNYIPQSFDQLTLDNNGLTINIKYHRKEFTITWMNGEEMLYSDSYRYGAHFLQDKPADPAPAAGKHFFGWNTTADATGVLTFNGTETVKGNTTYYAIFADNASKKYHVEHYQQNADNDGYTIIDADTEEDSKPFGSQTTATAKSYEGFTAQPFSQQAVAEDESTVIKIYYDRNEYTVTWKNGDATVLSDNYKYGSTLQVPDNLPDGQGVRFLGWNTDQNASSAETVVGQTVPLNGATYYAIFVETGSVDYTINHNLQDLDENNYTLFATGTGTGQIDFQTTASANTYPGFTVQPFNQETIAESGTVVNIYYNRNKCDVIWMKGEEELSRNANVSFGAAIQAPTDPTAEAGNHFVGWNSDPQATTKMNLEGATVSVGGNTYYAIFAQNASKKYHVEHYQQNVNDNGYTKVDTDEDSKPFGLQTTAEAKNYEGFTAQSFTQKTIAEDESTVVEIYYNRKTHTITWDKNGGDNFTGNYTTGNVKFGASITAPTATRTGYTFFGWNTTTDPTQTVTVKTTMPDNNLTYYAIWRVNQYYAAFYYNNPAHDNEVFTGMYINYQEPITRPNGNPQSSDYDGHHDFVGWSNNSTGNNILTGDNFGIMTTAGAKFYAIWQIHSNTLTWNANGGDALTGNYTSGTVDYDTEIIAPNTPTREGYTFMGWATSENGTPADVDATMPDYELNYYAIWQINSRNIAWNRNANDDIALEGDFTTGTVNFGTTIVKPNDPERIGYDFKGWATSAEATTAETVATTMPDNDLTYYAVWEVHNHQLTWYPNGGEFTNSDPSGSVAFGTAITMPLVNRTDWKMAGWATSAYATPNDVETPAQTMPDNDLTYYAIWILKTNYVTWKQNYSENDDANFTATSVEVGDPIVAPTGNPTREHYQFLGWSATRDGIVINDGDFGIMDDSKKEFYARWKINSHNLTWNANNGVLSGDYTKDMVEYGTTITPATATRIGYDFKGWALSTNPTVAAEISTMPDNDVEYIAIWEAKTYDVTWMKNDGTNEIIDVTHVVFDSEILATNKDVAREHYKFNGWAATPEGEVIADFGTLTTEGATFYAKWELHKYVLGWDANGGQFSGDYTQGEVEYGTEIVAPTATRDNYTPAGWGTTVNPDLNVNITTMPDSSVTYVAIWLPNNYIVEWRKNDGTEDNYQATNVDFGNPIVAPENPERAHYQFLGWSETTDGDVITEFGNMVSDHKIFYAQWQINSHTITWNTNGGDALTGNYTNGTVDYDTKIIAPDKPTREGYTYNGWNTYANAVDSVSITTMPDNNIEYFAIWKVNSYNVTWIRNDGTNDTYTTTEVAFGNTIEKPVNPSRENYQFAGWAATADGEVLTEFGTMDDVNGKTFFAQWMINSHTLAWNANGGELSGNYTTGLVEFGTTITTPEATRTGYTFKGWGATSTATENDKVEITTMPDADVEYFAIWEANNYSIVWNMNDGTDNVFATTHAIFEGNITAPAENPERDQFTFLGWAATESGTAIDSFGLMTAADTAFFAIWEAVEDTTVIPATFTVTWLMNNGTDSVFTTSSLAENDTIVAPAEKPIREQFTFLGWATTETGIAIDSFGLMPGADTAFFAVWEAVEDTTGTFAATWYMNNGTDSIFVKNRFAQGDSIAAPAQEPDRDGYTFIGWSAEMAGTLVTDFGTITADTAFYAVWEKNKYLVTWKFSQDSIFKTDTIYYGDAINAPIENPEQTGYVFEGWAAAANGDVIANFGTIASDTAFYAVWEIEVVPQYRAVWYFNDGTNSAFTTTMVALDASITAPTSNPKRDNYLFKGWSESTTGSVTTDFGTMSANGAAFYAIWEPLISFTVPEIFNSCESGTDHIELKDINNSQITFEWNVNGDIDSIQTDGYFEFTEEMALSGTIEVTGILGDARVTKTINYQRNKDMMRTMWDDVITVINGKGYFQSYRWYQNGVLVDTTDMHYEKGGLTGTYKLVAVTTDSLEITSCEMTFGDNEYVSISAYPNPVVNTVRVEGSDVKIGNRISIVDSDGKVRMTKDVTDESGETINMSNLPQGIYIVKVGTQSVSIIKL
ncbi:MAG: InlB B-repeat-containing protein [Salinivirgaceae bacterium]|nr:InlB B-repeat-containing protein [Salinivirgaceae bacterium]